jgi:hypothetical protein
VNLH